VAGIVTIAVLPLVNLSADPDNEYFSDGLTEELIHALTKLPGMRVVAWTTAARMRGGQKEIGAIRQQLQVGTVLTGSVRIAGPSLRVRSQLIDTETGVYLWSETFDRQMQDVFAIQEEIARAIVRTLRAQLTGKQESAFTGRGRTTVSSYDWYLKGRICNIAARRSISHKASGVSKMRWRLTPTRRWHTRGSPTPTAS
jgi:serine/threonine-protein kinase